jgi:hypothetical protein
MLQKLGFQPIGKTKAAGLVGEFIANLGFGGSGHRKRQVLAFHR